MAFNPPYGSYGQAQFRPGHIVEHSRTTQHFAATFAPNPLVLSATFAGNITPIVANAQYRVFITDFNAAETISMVHNQGPTLNLNSFNNFFTAAISGYAELSTNNAATVWNTVGLQTITITQRSFLNVSNVIIRLEKTVAGTTTVTQLVSIAPQSNSGNTITKYGRFMSYDTAFQNLNSLAGNNPFPTVTRQYAVKHMDTAEFVANGFKNFAGVSLYNAKWQNPYRDPSIGHGIYNTVRVARTATILVANSTAAAFNGQFAGDLYIETAAGVNQATLTSAASATAVLIPGNIAQCVDTRSYPGGTVIRLNAV